MKNPFVSPIVKTLIRKGGGVGVQPWCIVKFKDLKVQFSKSGQCLFMRFTHFVVKLNQGQIQDLLLEGVPELGRGQNPGGGQEA